MSTNPPKQRRERNLPAELRNREISARLRSKLSGFSFCEVARETGFNAETVRRYLRGANGIPGSFLGIVCDKYSIDADWLLSNRKWDACKIQATLSSDGTEVEITLSPDNAAKIPFDAAPNIIVRRIVPNNHIRLKENETK